MPAASKSIAADAGAGALVEAAVAEVATVLKSKPWSQSLTVQGGLLAAAAGGLTAYGPAIVAGLGGDHAAAVEICGALGAILSSVAGLMTVIGRLRLGGLR